jgi:hypothetical protein
MPMLHVETLEADLEACEPVPQRPVAMPTTVMPYLLLRPQKGLHNTHVALLSAKSASVVPMRMPFMARTVHCDPI